MADVILINRFGVHVQTFDSDRFDRTPPSIVVPPLFPMQLPHPFIKAPVDRLGPLPTTTYDYYGRDRDGNAFYHERGSPIWDLVVGKPARR